MGTDSGGLVKQLGPRAAGLRPRSLPDKDRSNNVVSHGTSRGVPFYRLRCCGRPDYGTNRNLCVPSRKLPWHTGHIPSCQAQAKGSASPGKRRPLLKDSSAAGTGAGDQLEVQLYKPPECGTAHHHLHSARPVLPQLTSRSGPQ